MKPTTTASRLIYENRWMRVREDRIQHPDGSPGLYGIVEKLDFSLIIPLDERGLYLIQQYRYPVRARYWEFPQGTWEDKPTAGPLEVAYEELQAETGLHAGSMRKLGEVFGAYGLTAQRCHIFLATQLTHGPARPDPEEQGLQVRHIDFADFPGMVADGQIKDAATLAAYSLLLFDQGTSLGPPRLAT
jgi:8-oxo-dGTP pyrophosphatase MutT (NUDIX family)